MGIVLFLASAIVGYCLLKQFSNSDRPVVSFCGAILVGCVLSGTALYLIDLFLVRTFHDYFNGTLLYLTAAVTYIFYSYKRLYILERAKTESSLFLRDRAALWSFILFLVFSAWINWNSLNLTSSGDIHVANGAWSDLIYHLSYLRSIALGNNIPIQYPYFANEPIRYHFLFDYFTGKISQLGLHPVHALNLMSTAGMVCLLMLTFEFGRLLFKSALTGFLGAVFLIFHGSFSVFSWIKENLHDNILQRVVGKDGWLSGASFEVWGLFNLNVFINQRHFAFGLALLVLLVIFLIKLSEETESADPPLIGTLLHEQPNAVAALDPPPDAALAQAGTGTPPWLARWVLRLSPLTATGRTQLNKFSLDYSQLKLPLLWALVIGCMPFWNALFAAISIILLVAFAIINYTNKALLIRLLLTAMIASLIVYPQLMLFKSGESALAGYPTFHFGYALSTPSVTGFILYYFRVLGLKLLMILVALLLLGRRSILCFLIFLIPFALANIFQLSSVLYDNNKLIIASLAFVNCYAAYTITYLFKRRRIYLTLLAIVLTVSVTLAGVVDFFAAKNLAQTKIADETSSLKWWVINHTEPRSVFLTNVFIPFADNAIPGVTLAGRYLYVVTNCVSSSCFVDGRIENARKIYSFEGGLDQVKSLLAKEKIDYVLIDEHVRNNPQLGLNERAFIENFRLIYREQHVSIFAP